MYSAFGIDHGDYVEKAFKIAGTGKRPGAGGMGAPATPRVAGMGRGGTSAARPSGMPTGGASRVGPRVAGMPKQPKKPTGMQRLGSAMRSPMGQGAMAGGAAGVAGGSMFGNRQRQ